MIVLLFQAAYGSVVLEIYTFFYLWNFLPDVDQNKKGTI